MNAAIDRPDVLAGYDRIQALSQSGMKDLAVSPLRFWHLWLNPERPERRETPEMRFGTALHCAVLQPDVFSRRYCMELSPDDFEGCLVTMDDLRQWVASKGGKITARNKAELIAGVLLMDPNAPVWDVIRGRHEEANEGRIMLSRDEWERVEGAASALRSEPRLGEILSDGEAEVALTATCPETRVPLKCRIDWITPKLILDIKTFSQQRGKSIDRSVTDAVFYERYYRQAWLYSYIESITSGRGRDGAQNGLEFTLAFVESDPPHETRIRVLRPRTAGNPNLYWLTARQECMGMMRTYAACMAEFGPDKPWRSAQEADPLMDEELPQMAFGRAF